MRKSILILLCTVLCILSLSACNPAADNDADATETPQQTTSGTTADENETQATTTTEAETSTGESAASGTTKTASVTQKATTTKKSTTASSAKSPVNGATLLAVYESAGNGVTASVHKLKYQGFIFWVAKINAAPAKMHNSTASQLLPSGKLYGTSGFGTSLRLGTLNDMASAAGAVIAINNEFFRGHGSPYKDVSYVSSNITVVKDGKVVQKNTGAAVQQQSLFFKDGTWKTAQTVTNDNVNSLISQGLSFTNSESGMLIWNGSRNPEYTGSSYYQKTSGDGRTVFAQIDKNNYLFIVGERTHYGWMTDVAVAYGAQKAFYCNGGNCASIYLKGYGTLNTLEERDACKMIDCLYFK